MIYFCCTNLRRDAVKQSANLNGIDFLEVLDDPTLPNDQRQRQLFVHFLKALAPNALEKKNIRVDGGERITNIQVVSVSASAEILTVEVDEPGDFSIYTLRLLKDASSTDPDEPPPDGFDPLLSAVEFSFKVECPNDFDCKPTRECPPEPRVEPELDYLAKDYNSFRQLMLDRMSALMPQWQERDAADLGVALVELLAYVGDRLSYHQDAIATEAYLGTALHRVSARRHARLVDYQMHDGCNARAWIHLETSTDSVFIPLHTQLLTRLGDQPPRISTDPQAYNRALAENPEVFETMHDATLFAAHNQIDFYTWGESECCLPKGAISAELDGHFPNLQKGDVLIFEEVLGPDTGQPGDADPAHRQAVRLTQQPVLGEDPLNGNKFTKIKWADEDALAFPLCISSKTDTEHGAQEIEYVSVVLGNIVLADHGMTVANESLGVVPEPVLFLTPSPNVDRCAETPPVPIPPRYRPALSKRPLTQIGRVLKTQIVAGRTETARVSFDPDPPAAKAFQWKMADTLPAIQLTSVYEGNPDDWAPQKDLLNSDDTKTEFVAEVDNDGTACLRFGDNEHGRRPDPGTTFTATYRVGNGTRGNVGADSIVHIVSDDSRISSVRNPLAAQGGVASESIEDVRQRAPYAFRAQERAVTANDYALVAQRDPEVQRATGTFRWTGSWRTMFVTIDRFGGAKVDDAFKQEVEDELEAYRMAGQDLDVNGPIYVSLEIEMQVCIKPDYFRSAVKQALLEIFSNHVLPDGRLGAFHPDNFTFGQTIFLSPLYAAAQAVEGVESVVITKFQRQGSDSDVALNAGRLDLGRLEIARCDNDPNFPERGVFRLTPDGGK
jgi:Baseplate J-like protein